MCEKAACDDCIVQQMTRVDHAVIVFRSYLMQPLVP